MAVSRLWLVAAAALSAAAVSPAASAAPRCSPAAARAAIAVAKPRLVLIGQKELITPDMLDVTLCYDVTRDGRADLAVSLASGGTAGVVGWLFFVAQGSGWRLGGSGTGYKLDLLDSGAGLLTVQPVYRKNDPNCCPTGGFDRTLYRWNGSRLVVARSWHTKKFL